MIGLRICIYTNIGKNMVTPTLQQEITQLEANFCAALSDPNRLLILYALNDGPRNVTELASELGLNQPTTSRHLKVLRERGLVNTIRTGTVITYHLADSRLIQALDIMRSIMRERLAYQANLMEEVHEAN